MRIRPLLFWVAVGISLAPRVASAAGPGGARALLTDAPSVHLLEAQENPLSSPPLVPGEAADQRRGEIRALQREYRTLSDTVPGLGLPIVAINVAGFLATYGVQFLAAGTVLMIQNRGGLEAVGLGALLMAPQVGTVFYVVHVIRRRVHHTVRMNDIRAELRDRYGVFEEP